MANESFQAQLSLTTVNGAAPTVGRAERCSVTRTGEGVLSVVVSEAIATGDADIALTAGLQAGVLANLSKGVNDFTWTIQTFIVTAGALVADDAPGAVIHLTLKRVDPA